MRKTVAILGATGKTGKWAVKGAIQRGWHVRLLVRDPSKIPGLLEELFPRKSDVEVRQIMATQVATVRCPGFEVPQLVEVMTGADALLSFVGQAAKGESVVGPAVEGVLAAMSQMQGAGPRTFVLQSAIGTDLPDSKDHAKEALGVVTMWGIDVFLSSTFEDMTEGEELVIEGRRRLPSRDLKILRCPILKDAKGLKVNYRGGCAEYSIIPGGEDGNFSYQIDRQVVAQAALDLSDPGICSNLNLSLSSQVDSDSD